MTNRDLYMAYMKGWRAGASAKALDPRFTEHPNLEIRGAYTNGYGDGHEASKAASRIASGTYSYEPTILRA